MQKGFLFLKKSIRDYTQDWETKLKMFLQGETSEEELPQVVGYVDRSLNRDYRSPSWNDVYLAASDFSIF